MAARKAKEEQRARETMEAFTRNVQRKAEEEQRDRRQWLIVGLVISLVVYSLYHLVR